MLKHKNFLYKLFFYLNTFLKSKFFFNSKLLFGYFYSILMYLILATTTTFFFKISCIFALYNYILSLFVFYFFLNTWFYFYNIYRYSKYTSVIQRFWKRTYMLFWLIEFFLFAIYIYLYFISPSEGYYFYSSSNSNFIQNQFLAYDGSIYFLIVILCIISNAGLFCIKNNNNIIFFYIWYIIFIIYSYILFYEFYKAMSSLFLINRICFTENLLKQNSFYFTKDTNTISLHSNLVSDDVILYRIFTYFNIITIFLKFWHIFFIYSVYILTTISFLKKNLPSFDSVSIICQNNIYVFLFASLINIFYLKKIFSFFSSDFYFWEKNTSISNFFFIFNEFSIYFFF